MVPCVCVSDGPELVRCRHSRRDVRKGRNGTAARRLLGSTSMNDDLLPEARWTVRYDGRITGWPSQAEQMLGWGLEEVMDRSIFDTLLRGFPPGPLETLADSRPLASLTHRDGEAVPCVLGAQWDSASDPIVLTMWARPLAG
jgi:PAS domain-containing protein